MANAPDVSGILGTPEHPLDKHIDALDAASQALKAIKASGVKIADSKPPLTPDSNQYNPDSPTGRFSTRSPRP